MTDAEMQTLAAALRSETNAGVVAAMAIRDDVTLVDWCNSFGAVDAWREDMSGRELFEAAPVVKFRALLIEDRDAWRLMLDFAPIDFTRAKMRKAVQEIWGDVESVAVLNECRRKATNAEAYLGGPDATTNTVMAKKLVRPGHVSIGEMSTALNRF